MNCKFCDKEINNKGGLVKHELGCNSNPNKVVYISNFSKYNREIALGLRQPSINSLTLTQELREKRRGVMTGNQYRLGDKVNTKTKEILSRKRSEYLEETGKGGFRDVKWYKIKNLLNEEFIVRGSWELKVAEWLNKNNILWKRKIYLKYEKDGVKKTYTPDFYLPITNQYIEVKGYFSQLDKEKLELVQTQNNIALLLWFGKDIKQLDTKLALVSPLSYKQ